MSYTIRVNMLMGIDSGADSSRPSSDARAARVPAGGRSDGTDDRVTGYPTPTDMRFETTYFTRYGAERQWCRRLRRSATRQGYPLRCAAHFVNGQWVPARLPRCAGAVLRLGDHRPVVAVGGGAMALDSTCRGVGVNSCCLPLSGDPVGRLCRALPSSVA
jgi:hypothetical protein